ncbi:hypothetical protein [Microbacterium sp. NPDC096154]|uniref:hypothetical protein n=1 Tax=Microbacterium sp. NPDC096154 TaxID=3155549 RepID=UPI000D81891D|nr:hypothetical protein BAY59_07065 [Prauserella coralliicola]
MTNDTSTMSETSGRTAEDYRTSEGLRALLKRLHAAGQRAWEHDPVAAELMAFAAEKYAALAHKHRLDPWEAASAAFDVMRTKAARIADDPWAVITHAVRITCIAEERGQGLLCSTHQARRPRYSIFHDPERLSDRENVLSDYHPAFQIKDAHDRDNTPEQAPAEPAATTAASAVEDAITLLMLLDWPEGTARPAVEHVCVALTRVGNRHTAYETLRRDKHARALIDLPGRSWAVLLRALLGCPDPALAATGAGRGILLRLLIGETLPVLLRDDDLVLTLSLAAPGISKPGARKARGAG